MEIDNYLTECRDLHLRYLRVRDESGDTAAADSDA